jgi:uncharacterized membrane protein
MVLFLIIILIFSTTRFDFISTLAIALLILTYSIIFYYEQINQPEELIIYQSHKFWIVTGCTIFYSGTLFIFLYTSDMKDKTHSSLWEGANATFEIIKNICFSIAILIAGRNANKHLSFESYDTNPFETPF